MGLLYLVAGLSVLVPAVFVPLALRRAPVVLGGRVAGRGRLGVRALIEGGRALIEAVGPVSAAVLVWLACSAALITVCWPLGEALSRLQDTVDWPVWRWVHERRDPHWEQLNATVTVIGERPPLLVLSIVVGLIFAVLWRHRGWWIPVVAMVGQFLAEQYTQELLKLVVDRGHPPTDLGSFPSGGVARVVVTFGTIALLATWTWRVPGRARIALGTAVCVGAVVEGYTRVYLQKHWLTDVVGGLVFGSLLLGGVAVTVAVLAGRLPGRPAQQGAAGRPPGAADPRRPARQWPRRTATEPVR